MKDVTVEVFFSETCPNCPPQKELAKEFNSDDVKVKLTNVSRNQTRAKNHGVRAVPTTIVDGPALDQKTGFRGVMEEEKLERAVKVAKGDMEKDELESSGVGDLLKKILPS